MYRPEVLPQPTRNVVLEPRGSQMPKNCLNLLQDTNVVIVDLVLSSLTSRSFVSFFVGVREAGV